MIEAYPVTILEDSTVPSAADRKYHYSPRREYEATERKRLERDALRSELLLQAITQAHLHYLAGRDLSTVFAALLRSLLKLTRSRLVTLCEANWEGPSLGSITVHHADGYNFAEDLDYLACLADQVLVTGKMQLSQPGTETKADGLLPDNSSTCFLGLPLTTPTVEAVDGPATVAETLGVIALAANAKTFDAAILEQMQPLLATCAYLLISHRRDLRLHKAEAALADLSRANEELCRIARAKDEFLATMNHELRTPLNTLLLHGESLQSQRPGPLNARQLRAVNGIVDSAHHLLLLINDTLEISKMDAGKLKLKVSTTGVEELCQSTLRLVSELALKKEIEVEIALDGRVAQIDADERRLKQMLVNLLSNAIKFTGDGGRVGLEVKGDPQNNCVEFTVWDTGIGISQDDIKKLFQPFAQLDNSHVRQHGGTGLGLFLVYRMAELHGGSVSVSSALGHGSRFTISLPWHQPQHLTAILPAPA